MKENRNKYEKKQRDKLTDRIIKRMIYCASRGKIKSDQITPEMIIEKRAAVLEWRKRKANPQPKPEKQIKLCGICGVEFTHSGNVCSDECRKEKARRYNYEMNSSKKLLKERTCKECGVNFIPEYGNKRREFCSDVCLRKMSKRKRRQKERARMKGAKVETVNAISVFERDKWQCQICKKKLKRKDKGTFKDLAPEMDHIIPLSKGGEHSYRNIQCVCRKCNGDKGSKEIGQLRMFG